MSTPQSGAAPRRAPNPRRRGAPRNRSANPADDTEQVRLLRSKYAQQLSVLQELFPDWSDEDLLFALQESGGDIELAVGRISEGHASQFASVKTKKQSRKEAAAAALTAPLVPPAPASAPASAPAAGAAPAEAPRTRGARGGERAARGRGAPAQAARAGRGGFRGVGARGGAAGVVPAAAQHDTKPVTTTQAAFPVSQAGAAERAQEKPKTGMSWAQIARPVEKAQPAPPAAPAKAESEPRAAAPAVPEPPIDTEITQPALAMAAAQNASEPAAAEGAPAAPAPSTSAAPSAPAPAPAPAPAAPAAPAPQPSARSSRARAHQDAPVVMPGGASTLDRLGVQFGSLNFMAQDDGQPLPAEDTGAARTGFDVDAKRDAPADASFQQPNLDAFKSHAFSGGHGSYGLGGRPPSFEQAEEPLHGAPPAPAGAGAQPSSTGFAAPSSIYNTPLDTQRNQLYYGHTNPVSSLRGEERSTPAGGAVPPPPPSLPTPAEAPQAQQPAVPGLQQQQPFPNVMPYYYPYYMPSQFQHYASPAGGFGQYQMYGGQPQHPSKPDATPTAPSLASPYLHHGGPADAAAVYGAQTPPPHFQPHGATSGAYDTQGFGQRVPGLGQGSDFKLQGNSDADAGGLQGLTNFLTAGQTPQGSIPPQGRGGAPNAAANSSPLDYRSFDGKSPAAGANRAAAGQPSGQPAQQPPAQQHPAYYQQYAGNFGHQGTAYNGYSYGRQQQPPYWG
ncbi:RNAPII degradation factor [Malassezia obtusa]|uniref:RNA polymerase II degradation factor 1 n=1 Tax=Malassezia obtusa TaxID=76774 RepID=A0AAF0DXH1_9BASI|nr:RNAPII degradation factor [Malassezia obtusa]